MKSIDFRPYILFVVAVISAILFIYISKILSFIIVVSALFFLFQKKYAFLFSLIYLQIFLLNLFVFIITDSDRLEDGNIKLSTPTTTIITSNSNKVIIGSVLMANLNKTDRKTRKPEYQLNDADSHIIINFKFLTTILQFRDKISEKMYYMSGGKVRVTQALIFGDKRFIDNDTRELYTVTGLAHLLAMSGLHVGMIILLAVLLISTKYKSLKYLVITALSLFIIVIGGFSITVIRASTMAILYIVFKSSHVVMTTKSFIIVVISLFIITSPESILSVSFLLSFGAVFGIVSLVDKKKSILNNTITVGVASTLITAPLSLYYFNTTNHLSILSTIVMIPIIQLQIVLGFLASIFTELVIPTLILIESFSKIILMTINSYTYFAFTLKSIPIEVLILTVSFVVATLLSRYKYLSLLSLLIIFYPSEKTHEYIFPNFKGSTKGFLSYDNNIGKIIYFSGTTTQFKYTFLPIIAKYGINSFEDGYINLVDSRHGSRYIKIGNKSKEFDSICLNYIYNDCKVVYHTRSNSIKKPPEDNNAHIIYKNKVDAYNIYILDNVGAVLIDNGVISFDKNFIK